MVDAAVIVGGRPLLRCARRRALSGTAGERGVRDGAPIVLLAVALVLGGCASGARRDCQGGDWEGLGYRDGRAGLGFERVGQLSDRCSDYAIAVDSAAWAAGHARGLEEYCDAGRGFDLGEAEGAEYGGNCPVALEGPFLAGYVRGLSIRRDRLQLDYDRLRRDLDLAQRRRAALLESADPGEDPGEDADRLDELDELDERVEALQDDLEDNLDERSEVNRRLGRWSRELR